MNHWVRLGTCRKKKNSEIIVKWTTLKFTGLKIFLKWIEYHLFTPSHYFSCICTKETKYEQCDFPTNFQVFEGNFHLFPGNHFPGNLLCYFISLKTFPGKLLIHQAFMAIKLDSKFFNANSWKKIWHGWGLNPQPSDRMSVALSKQLWNLEKIIIF